jgi:hypothetical protein
VLPISPHEAGRVQNDEAELIVNLFRAYGVGGSAWTLTRRDAGSGMSAGTITTRALTDLYVALRQDVGLPVNPVDTPIPSDAWSAVSRTEADLLVYDVLTSIDDPSLAFTVQSVSRNSVVITLAQLSKNDRVGMAY